MAFFKVTEHFNDLTEDIRAYIDSTVSYYRLDMFKKIMKGAVSLVNLLVIGSIFLIFLLFLSVAIAIWIGEAVDNLGIGYLIVGLIYFVIFILLLIFAKPIIRKAMLKRFSKTFFNKPTATEVMDDEVQKLTEP